MPPRGLAAVRDVLDADDAFRARVAAEVDEASAQRSTWLFLTRPPGWREEFDLLVDAVAADAAREEADRTEQAASRRVEHLEEALERQRVDAVRSTEDAAQARARLDEERDRARRAEAAAGAAESRLAAREDERAETVRQLAEARSLAESRLARLRGSDQEVARLTEALGRAVSVEPGDGTPDATASPDPLTDAGAAPDDWAGADPAAVADAVRRAADAAAILGETLAEAARALGAAGPADHSPPVVAPGPEPTAPVATGRRRIPIRLTRGAVEGTVEGTDQVLRAPGVVVLVDGYNVSMAGWPDLDALTQRNRLTAALADVGSRTGADVRVVFDGDDDGRRPAVSAPLPVRVHFTPAGVEADDVILDMVGRLPAERPVVVVSSDRRVQAGTRARGANVVASESLLAWARR